MEQAVFEVESRNENGTCETIRFPALDICGEVSFFLPYKMDLAGAELTWATASLFAGKERPSFPGDSRNGTGVLFGWQRIFGEDRAGGIRIPEKKISIVTLNLSDARFLRRLDGKLYLGEGCDLYLEDRDTPFCGSGRTEGICLGKQGISALFGAGGRNGL